MQPNYLSQFGADVIAILWKKEEKQFHIVSIHKDLAGFNHRGQAH